MDQQDYRRNLRKRDEVNGKQVGIGCLIFFLIMVVIALANGGGAAMTALGIIAIVALFLLGAFLTGAFKD